MRSGYLRTSKLLCGVALCAMTINSIAPIAAAAGQSGSSNDDNTTTPIKHVIVIIGENRTFDHLFATYQPVNKGESVLNLLSEEIVKADGTPGKNYSAATQNLALDTTAYQLSPPKTGAYKTLLPPLAPSGGFLNGGAPFATVGQAKKIENGLSPSYYKFLTTGGVPASIQGAPDTRIMYDGNNVNNLPPGPYQLTPGVPYDAYAESPVHRFYQMWQQFDCGATSGCQNDLFAWVEATVGSGSNGTPPPANFTYKEGATSMGFYNVPHCRAPTTGTKRTAMAAAPLALPPLAAAAIPHAQTLRSMVSRRSSTT